ncbi:MAG: protein kinase, partial [Gemmatimonadaceae bacterium]|nr:protein kinase [Gemmatimonadaceae bacterium]
TILTTVEIEDSFTSFEFSHYTISFLTDDIIRLRYVEIDGQIRKVLAVVKMRGGNHSKDIREYVITDKGLVINDPLDKDYLQQLTTGIPDRIGRAATKAGPEPKARSSAKK